MSKPSYVNFNVSKELIEEAFGILLDAKKIEAGTNLTTKNVECGDAKLVYIAEDVDPPEVVAHLPSLCGKMKIPYILVPSKTELGKICGKEHPCASACIVDIGKAYERYEKIKEKLDKIPKRKYPL